ncbi:MAG: hypothetical protein GY710_26515 [Desulfobacteraceae bacterium]|nr:hypothetical protein [Desulfobacteraceae bacterium]
MGTYLRLQLTIPELSRDINHFLEIYETISNKQNIQEFMRLSFNETESPQCKLGSDYFKVSKTSTDQAEIDYFFETIEAVKNKFGNIIDWSPSFEGPGSDYPSNLERLSSGQVKVVKTKPDEQNPIQWFDTKACGVELFTDFSFTDKNKNFIIEKIQGQNFRPDLELKLLNAGFKKLTPEESEKAYGYPLDGYAAPVLKSTAVAIKSLPRARAIKITDPTRIFRVHKQTAGNKIAYEIMDELFQEPEKNTSLSPETSMDYAVKKILNNLELPSQNAAIDTPILKKGNHTSLKKIGVGYTWHSPEGNREIIEKAGAGTFEYYKVQTIGSTNKKIISAKDINKHITRDLEAVSSSDKLTIKIPKKGNSEFNGFLNTIFKSRKNRITNALNKKKDNSQTMGHIVEHYIQTGHTVGFKNYSEHKKKGMISSNGNFLDTFSKIELEYAEYLLSLNSPTAENTITENMARFSSKTDSLSETIRFFDENKKMIVHVGQSLPHGNYTFYRTADPNKQGSRIKSRDNWFPTIEEAQFALPVYAAKRNFIPATQEHIEDLTRKAFKLPKIKSDIPGHLKWLAARAWSHDNAYEFKQAMLQYVPVSKTPTVIIQDIKNAGFKDLTEFFNASKKEAEKLGPEAVAHLNKQRQENNSIPDNANSKKENPFPSSTIASLAREDELVTPEEVAEKIANYKNWYNLNPTPKQIKNRSKSLKDLQQKDYNLDHINNSFEKKHEELMDQIIQLHAEELTVGKMAVRIQQERPSGASKYFDKSKEIDDKIHTLVQKLLDEKIFHAAANIQWGIKNFQKKETSFEKAKEYLKQAYKGKGYTLYYKYNENSWNLTVKETIEINDQQITPGEVRLTLEKDEFLNIDHCIKQIKQLLPTSKKQDTTDQETSKKYPAVLSYKHQKSQSTKYIGKLFNDLGIAEEIANNEDYYRKVFNEPWLPLTIERHNDEIFLTHYYEQNGDLVMDGEMVFKIQPETGRLFLKETAVQNPILGGEHRAYDSTFANIFAKNINGQKFGECKAIDPRKEKPPKTRTQPDFAVDEVEQDIPLMPDEIQADTALFFDDDGINLQFLLKQGGLPRDPKKLLSLLEEKQQTIEHQLEEQIQKYEMILKLPSSKPEVIQTNVSAIQDLKGRQIVFQQAIEEQNELTEQEDHALNY